jgi:ribosomal protein S27AE
MQAQDAEGSAARQLCPRCGADDWQVDELGSIARAWSWLQGGRPVLRERLTCRRCGFTQVIGHGSGSVHRLARHATSWWGAPIRIVRALLRGRTLIPSPLIYLMVGALGVGLGIVLDRVIGWPWWSVAFGSVVVVWIVFLATAFGPASRRMQTPVRTRIRDALDPMGMFDRLERRLEQVFRDRPFAIYGLDPAWEGPRFIGEVSSGWHVGAGDVGELELVHGDVSHPSGTLVRVASSPSSIGEPRDRRRELAEQLWLEIEPPPPRESPERFIEWEAARARDHRSRPTPDFRTIELPVDGEAISFSFMLEQNAWVALGYKEDITISITARDIGIEDVSLVTIRDVEPYIEGRRRLLEPPSEASDG